MGSKLDPILGPQMDPILGPRRDLIWKPKSASFWEPQIASKSEGASTHNAPSRASSRKRSTRNLMDALMGLQAHPPREFCFCGKPASLLKSRKRQGFDNNMKVTVERQYESECCHQSLSGSRPPGVPKWAPET